MAGPSVGSGRGRGAGSGATHRTGVGKSRGKRPGLGSAAGQFADLAALDLGGRPPIDFGTYYADDADDVPSDLIDWDDDYPDDDSDDMPRSEPERAAGPSAHPVIVFEFVEGVMEFEVPWSMRTLGSPSDAQRHRRRLMDLAAFLAVNHSAALAAPTLSQTFALLPSTTQESAAAAMQWESGTAFSRWYAHLFVAAPAAILPVTFLFARGGDSYRQGALAPVLASAIGAVRNQRAAGRDGELTRTEVTAILDVAVDGLSAMRSQGQTTEQLRDSVRKVWPVMDRLVAHSAEVTAFRRTWPQCSPYDLLAAVGITKTARTAGVTFAWAALSGALDS